MSSNIVDKIKTLTEKLHQYNYEYYILDKPTVSDFIFDQLLKELQEFETEYPELGLPNSPTQRVGGGVSDSFKTVTHKHRMYSLDNSYNKEDLLDWEKKIKKLLAKSETPTYFCELKYDGASISISYKNGQFEKAVTRGDGFQGDDISRNVKTIKSVPLQLQAPFPEYFTIRGEIVLPFKGFQQMNAEKIAKGEEPYANPRNTASGSIKLQDSKEVAKRPLECLLYNITAYELPYETQEESLVAARKMGFRAPKNTKACGTIEEVIDFISYWDNARHELPYETDGVVVKVNSLFYQQELGFTSKSPRWAIAYKFETEQAETRLKSITYQVGRTGAITPVANLGAVLIAGTTVRRASLHNADVIEKLQVRENDSVFVEKGGEIIPKIVGVNFTKRTEDSVPFTYIDKCPECESKLVRKEGEALHYCLNDQNCPPQIKGKISHYISRKALNIDGLGEETIELLFEAGLVKNYSDLYHLKLEQILPLERMAQKSTQNIIDGIIASKKQPFDKVLFGLGIRHVGSTVAKKLAKHYLNIDSLSDASLEELIEVDDIGAKIAESIIAFFAEKQNQKIIETLKNTGVQLEMEAAEIQKGILKEQSFLFTGKLNLFTRSKAQKLVEENGGINLNSVSKKLNYLVIGEKAGSKLAKAEKLGTVQIITEEEFLKLIDEN